MGGRHRTYLNVGHDEAELVLVDEGIEQLDDVVVLLHHLQNDALARDHLGLYRPWLELDHLDRIELVRLLLLDQMDRPVAPLPKKPYIMKVVVLNSVERAVDSEPFGGRGDVAMAPQEVVPLL